MEHPTHAVPTSPDSTPPSSTKKRITTVIIWIAGIIVLGILITCIVIGTSKNPPLKQFEQALSADNFSAAYDYIEQLSDEDLETAHDLLLNRAASVFKDYDDGRITYNEAICTLNHLKEVATTKEIMDLSNELAALSVSKEAYQAASKAEAKGNIALAIKEYQSVIANDRLYERAQERLTQLRSTYKQDILIQSEELAGSGKYIEAIALLDTSLMVLENDCDILSKKGNYTSIWEEEIVANALRTAEAYVAGGNYRTAITTLGSVNVVDARITERIAEYKTAYRQTVLDSAAEDYSAGLYEKAISHLSDGLGYFKNDNELTAKKTEYETAYRMTFFAEAEALAEQGDYEQAVACLSRGVAYFGNLSEFSEKIQEYTSKYPVKLHKLTPCIGENHASNKSDEDIFGNQFTEGLSINCYSYQTDTFEYVSNKMYQHFTATLLVSKTSNDWLRFRVKIYVDEELKFDSGELGKKSAPIGIHLDVSGATFIRFEIISRTPDYKSGYIYICDPELRQ